MTGCELRSHPVRRKSAVNAFLWREKLRLNRDVKICDSPASVPKGTPRTFSRKPKLRSNSRGRYAPPACPAGNQNLRPNSPGRARGGCEPSRTPSPRGCRGAERPTLASSGTKIFIRILRESSRGPQPSRLPIEAGDLRGGKVACPKGKQVASRPTKRNRRFRLVAPGR